MPIFFLFAQNWMVSFKKGLSGLRGSELNKLSTAERDMQGLFTDDRRAIVGALKMAPLPEVWDVIHYLSLALGPSALLTASG